MPCAGRDFGGSRESIDIDAEATAAREFAEETLGVFASMAVDACAVARSSASMAQQLRDKTHAMEIKRPLKQVRAVSHMQPMPHMSEPLQGHLEPSATCCDATLAIMPCIAEFDFAPHQEPCSYLRLLNEQCESFCRMGGCESELHCVMHPCRGITACSSPCCLTWTP